MRARVRSLKARYSGDILTLYVMGYTLLSAVPFLITSLRIKFTPQVKVITWDSNHVSEHLEKIIKHLLVFASPIGSD